MGERLDQPQQPGWVERLGADDSARIQTVLTDFGVDCYTIDNPMPVHRVAATLAS